MILKRQMESMKVTRWISIWMVWISFLVVIGYGSGGGGGDDSGGGSGSNAGSGLQLGSYSMGFTADQNGPAPSTQSITVTVTAPDATYLYAGYPPLIPIPTWLDMAIAGSDSPFSLDLSVNFTWMPVGTHSTTVRVLCARSDDTVIGYREISVPCTITNELTVSQQTLGDSCITGTNSNPWTATLTTDSGGSWLLVDATSGMISAASASINVDADHTALNHNSKKRWNYPGGMGSMMLSHSPSSSPHQFYTSGLAKWRHAVRELAV